MGASIAVAQFDTKGNFTGKIYGPFPTIERATEFQESATVGGYYYVRLTVTTTDKEVIRDAVAAYSNLRK